MVKNTLESMDPTNGAVIPRNLEPNKCIHISADNIDILDESLDGTLPRWRLNKEEKSSIQK